MHHDATIIDTILPRLSTRSLGCDSFKLPILVHILDAGRINVLERVIEVSAKIGLCVVLLLLAGCGRRVAKKDLTLPPLMIWAWDRPEDLRFINPASTGVAYLAGTVEVLHDGVVRVRMRQEVMQLPTHTALLPVVRIQSSRGHAPADVTAIVAALQRVAAVDGGQRVQIDFDARQSEQGLYREILKKLPNDVVSMTALASWCRSGSWLDSGQMNEAVPMLFRMGHAVSLERVRLELPECTTSLGLSMDESWPAHRPIAVRRIYLFNPHAWTAEDYDLARRRIEAWK